ncbi:MAG TPA: heavy metal-binding domain-containing protein [Solirubrobacteraceae bacterium]
MGFFGQGGESDGEQDESLERIEAGGIPLRAEARLRALGAEGSMFTSGLSVNEFALLHRLGPRPLAQVMGASVVRTGWQYLPALDPGTVVVGSAKVGRYAAYGPTSMGSDLTNRMTEPSQSQIRNYQWHAEVVCELDTLTDAWNLARRRALDRLAEEALQVGADAVVGVHVSRNDHDLGRHVIEFVVTGTAIRDPDSRGASRPILTDVSVQDYWRLRSAGHDPVGLIATTAVMFASPARDTRMRRVRATATNQELGEVTRAFALARVTTRSRLLTQVSDAHGTGAVGVQLSHSVRREKFSLASSIGASSHRGWNRRSTGLPYYVRGRADADRSGWVITMHAAGTAIRDSGGPGEQTVKTQIRMGAR